MELLSKPIYECDGRPSGEGHDVGTTALIFIGSVAIGAASAFSLTSIGVFVTSLIFAGALLAIRGDSEPTIVSVLAAVATMQVVYVATGWLRER